LKKKLPAEKRRETHCLSNGQKVKWIEDYLDRGTAMARMRDHHTVTLSMLDQDQMGNVEKGRSTTTKPEITFQEMLNAIGESLSDLTSTEDEQDGEVENDYKEGTELGKLTEDNKPGWVICTITNTVLHRMQSFGPKQMTLNELTQLAWGDTAEYFCKRVMKYRSTESKVPAVARPQTVTTAATPSPTASGDHMQKLDVVHGQVQMPQVTSRQRSSQMMLGPESPQADSHIVSLTLDAVPDSSQMEIANPVQPLSFYPCI
jgi:hypothetical protein